MRVYYLLALLTALSGMAYGDWSKKLVIFRNPRLYSQLIALGASFFLLWDAVGILLQIFATNQKFVSGIHIVSPDLPIEEILFVILLSYVTLLTWRIVCLRTS